MAATTTPVAARALDPDPAQLFDEAREICQRDAGQLWGISLCGPMLLVDPRDRSAIGSEADAEGRLASDKPHRGRLPADVIVANTPTEWSGTRWTQLLLPMPEDAAERHVLLVHELFHRVQPALGLAQNAEGGNRHLDTYDGRYLLQLEWRALDRALGSMGTERRRAIADALAFRADRHRLFPRALAEETALELVEGIAEYTGVRLGLNNTATRTAYARRNLTAFVDAPSFVRSFAYATGAAYGLLLDELTPDWRTGIDRERGLAGMVATALPLGEMDEVAMPVRTARYDDGMLRRTETARERERVALLASYRALLVDGPVLFLPLDRSRFQFNPQTLVPLDGFGMVYPTMLLMDTWGSLEVESGGAALVRDGRRGATVSATDADVTAGRGKGWRLTLNPGWRIVQGDQPGNYRVAETTTP